MLTHLVPKETTLLELIQRLSSVLPEDGQVVGTLTQLLRSGRIHTRDGVPIRLAEEAPGSARLGPE